MWRPICSWRAGLTSQPGALPDTTARGQDVHAIAPRETPVRFTHRDELDSTRTSPSAVATPGAVRVTVP